jgi:hypothetical protein
VADTAHRTRHPPMFVSARLAQRGRRSPHEDERRPGEVPKSRPSRVLSGLEPQAGGPENKGGSGERTTQSDAESGAPDGGRPASYTPSNDSSQSGPGKPDDSGGPSNGLHCGLHLNVYPVSVSPVVAGLAVLLGNLSEADRLALGRWLLSSPPQCDRPRTGYQEPGWSGKPSRESPKDPPATPPTSRPGG